MLGAARDLGPVAGRHKRKFHDRSSLAARGAGGGYRFIANPKRLSLYDVVNLFGDIAGNAGEIPGPAGDTDIGRALTSVLAEIDEIAIATFKAISLATLLKSLDRSRETKLAAE